MKRSAAPYASRHRRRASRFPSNVAGHDSSILLSRASGARDRAGLMLAAADCAPELVGQTFLSARTVRQTRMSAPPVRLNLSFPFLGLELSWPPHVWS